jgi:hypothetical protein
MIRREATSWHHMMFQYGLANAWKLDIFQKMSKKEYTFDNRKFKMRSAISRINKFIVFRDLGYKRG